MNKKWTDGMLALILAVLVPGLLCNTVLLLDRPDGGEIGVTVGTEGPTRENGVRIRVLLGDGSVENMELEAYLVGVVLGEMPESFHPEALKAQAVVARTYALRMRERSSKHPGADVCTDPRCCQSYREGDSPAIRSAVEDTEGLVLTYGGALIEATYFSSAGGRTEDAVAVWGSDVPYLQAVDSPETGEGDDFLETVTMTAEEFRTALGIAPEGPLGSWLGEITYTDGGGVDTMVIGGREFKGTDLRRLLGLRSTAMVMSAVGDHILITTRGYGHRVGMSQYGADAMAAEGASFKEILAHYYRGTTLELFVDKESPIG